MKVVYTCSLDAYGPLTHLLDLAPRVARAGPDVLVLCANEEIAAEFRARGVEARPLPLRHKIDGRGAARLWPALRDADIVHTHDRRTGLLARPVARLHGAACVHTLHGVPNEIFGLVGRADARLPPDISLARAAWLRYGVLGIEAALARLGTTVVPSEALRRFLLAHGFPKARTVLIPNGEELRRAQPEERHDPFRVASASILNHRKGVDVLLEACARVDVPLSLDVYGDGILRSELEAHAARIGIDATFHGRVADIPERLREADLFVLATRGDNLPVAVLEAMSLALPVVTTRTGGLPELVLDGETGLLVEPEDANGLATAIGRVARDEELRLRFGRAAAGHLQQRFDPDVTAREMVALYRRLRPSLR
jgi:glycosyltransferase involved in cell wall biosynthesis